MYREGSDRHAQAILQEIRTDVHSGATEITRKAVSCLLAFTDELHPTPAKFRRDLMGIGRSLVAAQPKMASLFNLINHTFLAVEPLPDSASLPNLQKATQEAATNFQRVSDAALQAIAQHGQGLITSSCTVFVHSSSNTVAGILRQAVRQNKAVNAIVTESRPHCEGREMARFLGQQGISTKLILDAAIAQYVKQADVILMGVDRIMEDSFINKVGTLAVVMAAKLEQVPVYLACGSSKFLSASLTPPEDVSRRAEESTHEEWQNVELVYSFFEEIPTSYVTGVISEEGILSMNALTKRFRAYRVCQELLRGPAVTP
jgi:translation initiation factor eIF-2B subunit delta